jgi:hypothetical protein
VSYRVEGREHDGRWTALGQPSSGAPAGASQGFELPTTPEWPAGDYRVRITVADEGGSTVAADLPFHLDAAGSGDPTE